MDLFFDSVFHGLFSSVDPLGMILRTLMALLIYAKAMAYFRGNGEVELEDLRQVLPFVLHNKLQPDLDAPFFALPENAAYRSDRLGWLRRHTRTIQIFGGVLLILVGVALVTGLWNEFVSWVRDAFVSDVRLPI